MTLKHTFNSLPNPKYKPKEIQQYAVIEKKLIQAKMDISFADASNSNLLQETKETIDRNLSSARLRLKKLLDEPKTLQTVHITSNKVWKLYPEEVSEECGRTRYQPAEEFRVDTSVPYSRKIQKRDEDNQLVFDESDNPVMCEVNVKDALRQAGNEALEKLKEYRKKSRELQVMERTFSIPGLPIAPKYKVYAGNGHGGPECKYLYTDKLRGTSLEVIKPEQKDNFFIHLEGGTFLKLQEAARTRKVFERKKPITNEHHVGVEIEFVSKMDKFELATELCRENVQDFVFLTDDASIRFKDKDGNDVSRAVDEFKYSHELTILSPEPLVHEVLRRVLKAVNKEDKSKVGGRCGMHVHLDMRNRDKKHAFYNLSKAQRILYAMNPRSRLDGTTSKGKKDQVWSKKIEASDFDVASVEIQGSESRYYGINIQALQKHGTIEIRIHSGSTNFEKISNWVRILTTIVNLPTKVETEAAKAETFCEYYGLDQSMVDYINARITKFKDKEGKHITIDEVA